ncbi:tetratricopeptide repeat-containing diguanylate cyclase [Thalassotalea mangrovi]|uniref:diguanylate cyclase n=1 Tax=Thalassotalea mangrovi TaxID=2572245 RepID=A0A4U1BAW6_9GAMM|nr:GGDEF domain-containing protein [Thalassotalea mangrovi]TKB47698.1 GGDEF domain-containing protein [Thalassotalea mangrovi]
MQLVVNNTSKALQSNRFPMCTPVLFDCARLLGCAWKMMLIISLSVTICVNAQADGIATDGIETNSQRLGYFNNWTTTALLDKANEVRSTDIELSKTLLALLQQRSLDESQQAKLAYLQAYRLIMEGNYQESLRRFQVLAEHHDINVRLQALSYKLSLYLLDRDYPHAVNLLADILELLPHPQIEPQLYTKTIMGIGFFHNQLGAYQKALNYFERLNNRHLTERQQCLVSAHKVDSLVGLKKISVDDILYQATLTYCQQINENIITEGVIAEMAQFQVELGNYNWVIDTLLPRLGSIEARNYPMNSVDAYGLLAVSFYHVQDYDNAWLYGTKAMSYSKDFKLSESLHAAAGIMASMAKTHGSPEQAYLYQIDYLQRQQRQYAQTRAREVVRQQLNFELQNHKKLFAELNSHLSKQYSTLHTTNREIADVSEQNRFGMLYIVICILIAAGLALSVFGIRWSRRVVTKQLQLDPLTQVYHRPNTLEYFSRRWLRIQQRGQSATLFCLQLDQLTDINYRNGHTIGDWLIEKAAQVIKENAPHQSLIGRYKGNMFVMLMPNTSMHSLLQIQGRVIQQLNRLQPSIFLTYKLSYQTTSLLMNLDYQKDSMHNILARCEWMMADKANVDGHKLIVEDGNSMIANDAKATATTEIANG